MSPWIAVPLIFVGSSALPVLAGMMLAAAMSGQPQMFMDSGQVSGCGIRIVGVNSPESMRGEATGFDVSVAVGDAALGMVKGGGFVMRAQDLGQPNARQRPFLPKAIWLRAQGYAATRAVSGAGVKSPSSPNSLIYSTADTDAPASVIGAILHGESIQVGITRPGEDFERIYYGKVNISDADRTQILQCLKDWSGSDRK